MSDSTAPVRAQIVAEPAVRAGATGSASAAAKPLLLQSAADGTGRASGTLLSWFADRLNPILVKETRQALKSRQFTITFGLLLLAAWGWTILVVAVKGPPLWYGAEGKDVFFGYFLVLTFPLLVIVPYGAMRSLAGEHEERTYDLLSITALGSRQIIAGKLGSAVLQMIVYLSAMAPCLAFTYMLRGIDFPTILFIICLTVLLSLGLSVLGLLVGTLSTAKHWQVVLSVVTILGLFLTFYGTARIIREALDDDIPFTDPDFWRAWLGVLTAYASYFVLFFLAAAARLSFPSDNRATPLRVVMLVQQLLLVGWFAWLSLQPGNGGGFLLAFMAFSGGHWYAMGVFMTGESPELSPRVKRRLPQSFLGRAFFTWFNPGPGTGYVYALASTAGAMALTVVAMAALALLRSHRLLPDWAAKAGVFERWPGAGSWAGGPGATLQFIGDLALFAGVELAYLALYLGAGLLLLRLLRKLTKVGMFLAALVHLLLLLLGTFLPMLVQQFRGDWWSTGYSYLHITNPFWSLGHLVESGTRGDEGLGMLALVSAMALAAVAANLPALVREVRQLRIAAPGRVAEEDAAEAARKRPPQSRRTSPWDEG